MRFGGDSSSLSSNPRTKSDAAPAHHFNVEEALEVKVCTSKSRIFMA